MKKNERKIKMIKGIIFLLLIILILFIFLVSWQKIVDEEKYDFNYSTEKILLSIRNDELKNINLKKNQDLSYNLNVENAKKMDIRDYQKLADEINYQVWDKEENNFYIDQINIFWHYDNELYIVSIDYIYKYFEKDDGDINIFTSTLKTTEIDIDGAWESINIQKTTYRIFPFLNKNQSISKDRLSATEALEIVEKKGGEDFRNQNKNNCRIVGRYSNKEWYFHYICDGGIEEYYAINSITGERTAIGLGKEGLVGLLILVMIIYGLLIALFVVVFILVKIIKVIRKKRNSSKEEEIIEIQLKEKE